VSRIPCVVPENLRDQVMDFRLKMKGMHRRLKPHLLMTLAQIGYTSLYFISEASFNRGMNPHVYVTYRYIVGGFFMLPFAYFLERYIHF